MITEQNIRLKLQHCIISNTTQKIYSIDYKIQLSKIFYSSFFQWVFCFLDFFHFIFTQTLLIRFFLQLDRVFET